VKDQGMSNPVIDIRPDHWQIVRHILRRHVPQYEVWAFGSRAKWTAKPHSDLDLAVITDKPLPLSVSAALADDFSESNLPWKVDVLDWATTSESFRKIIELDKVVIQGSVDFGGWRDTTVGDSFEVNPLRPLKRGSIASFVPMEVLPQHARAIERVETREYTGSGMRFRNGDTLIARITPCLENGKTAFVSELKAGEIGHGSTEYIVLSGKGDESDSLFGYYLARTPEFRLYAISHMEGTSGRQRVPASAVQKYPIALPPLTEQRAIAHILGTLDDKIELNRRSNETLEAMARALFKAWFVDFEPVRAKMEGRWQRGQSLPGLPAHLYDIFPDRIV
jgi:type I restriction enzyme S subunit